MDVERVASKFNGFITSFGQPSGSIAKDKANSVNVAGKVAGLVDLEPLKEFTSRQVADLHACLDTLTGKVKEEHSNRLEAEKREKVLRPISEVLESQSIALLKPSVDEIGKFEENIAELKGYEAFLARDVNLKATPISGWQGDGKQDIGDVLIAFSRDGEGRMIEPRVYFRLKQPTEHRSPSQVYKIDLSTDRGTTDEELLFNTVLAVYKSAKSK